MKEKSTVLDLENVKKAFKNIAEGARIAARTITKLFNEVLNSDNNLLSLINSNTKIVRLAKNHKKKRTRKKNINRFIKLIEKEYKCKLSKWQKDYIRRLLNEYRANKRNS